jgi:hypothetical protein
MLATHRYYKIEFSTYFIFCSLFSIVWKVSYLTNLDQFSNYLLELGKSDSSNAITDSTCKVSF